MYRWKIDLHTHTRHSRDALLHPAELVARARAAGFDRIAVTDHNTIAGAHEAAAIDAELVIMGEEIDCAGGAHLIGLFLTETIPPHRSIEETAERIRDQGGLVYAPHPFAYLKSARERARRVIAVADVVEVHNARAFAPAWNRRAATAAAEAGLPVAAGSDSHFAHEIGGAFTEIAPFTDAAAFRTVLSGARPAAVRAALPFVHAASLSVHLARRLTGTLAVPPHPIPQAR
ncbi:MAG TPA: PHP domain-containing protein [Longimicrobiales bacterium]